MWHSIKYFYRIIKRFGVKAAFFLIRSKFKKNKLENIYLKGIKSQIYLSNYGPDVTTLFQIFYAGEYDIHLQETPQFIIDCGANIGLSAVFFASKYPDALIVAIEPDENNFKYLLKNTEPHKNIYCLKKAIWPSNVKLEIIDSGNGNWGLQTKIADGDRNTMIVDGITLDQILVTYGKGKIDLLKIDIEGAEKELFSQHFENWLSKTKVIAIELHDGIDPNISTIFFNALALFSYNKYNKGENLICEFT